MVRSQDPKVGIDRFHIEQRAVRYGSGIESAGERDFTLVVAGVESTLSRLLEMHSLAETLQGGVISQWFFRLALDEEHIHDPSRSQYAILFESMRDPKYACD